MDIDLLSGVEGRPKIELACAYCPGVTPRTARRTLMDWINRHPDLPTKLANAGYHKKQRWFTPLQVALIYECLGPC
ncbi:MAG: DUF4248 domain-containing protein [Bacteroidaceae bacterium]|nr:DUF4248 domain-containing protein [Bacteroidaceae bacterium]